MNKIKPGFRRSCLFLLLVALLLVANGSASSQGEAFLNRFQGTWKGDGKAYGRPNHLETKWEWILGDKFLRLTLKNEMTGSNGQKQVFEAQAYYQLVGDGKYEARWFDSRGTSIPIKAHAEGDALVALWFTPDQDQGKTTYRIIEPRKIEVLDEVQQKDGSWKEFGRVVVTRE